MVNKTTTKQLSYWQGKFGDEYIKRNSTMQFFAKRRSFFGQLIKNYDVQSILEVGCNIGANLKIISEIDSEVELHGIEPNRKAVKIAQNSVNAKIIEGNVFNMTYRSMYDLVFTSGVLIHIADKDLKKALRKIYEASRRYILAIEYYSPDRKAISYRGLEDALYKRPYKKEYLTLFPNLTLLKSGQLKKDEGFDSCRYYLFEKSI